MSYARYQLIYKILHYFLQVYRCMLVKVDAEYPVSINNVVEPLKKKVSPLALRVIKAICLTFIPILFLFLAFFAILNFVQNATALYEYSNIFNKCAINFGESYEFMTQYYERQKDNLVDYNGAKYNNPINYFTSHLRPYQTTFYNAGDNLTDINLNFTAYLKVDRCGTPVNNS